MISTLGGAAMEDPSVRKGGLVVLHVLTDDKRTRLVAVVQFPPLL